MAKKGVTIKRVNEIPHTNPEELTMNEQTKKKRLPTKVGVKLALLLVIIFSTAALLTTYVYISHLQQTIQDLKQEASQLQEENQEKQNYVDHQGTDEGIKDVATGELGMVDPDTVIYDFD